MNKAIIVGRVGQEPKQFGKAVTVSIATNEKYKEKEETEWHRIVFFGKLGDVVLAHVKKGQAIAVSGRIKTSKYTDKDGKERSQTDILASEMKFV